MGTTSGGGWNSIVEQWTMVEDGTANGMALHRALGMEEFNGFVKGVPWVTEVSISKQRLIVTRVLVMDLVMTWNDYCMTQNDS
jgi:hypothetical protein